MPDSPVNIILSSPAASYRVGEPVPITIEVKNVSGRDILMAGVLDGSEAGLRYPKYLPEITGPAGENVTADFFWCGNVAPLHPRDLILLKPGEGFDPTAPLGGAAFLPLALFLNFRTKLPGAYHFRLTLDTLGGSVEEWLGGQGNADEKDLLPRISEIPGLRVVSNTLTIDVS